MLIVGELEPVRGSWGVEKKRETRAAAGCSHPPARNTLGRKKGPGYTIIAGQIALEIPVKDFELSGNSWRAGRD